MKLSDLDGLPRASGCRFVGCTDGRAVIVLSKENEPYTYVVLDLEGCNDAFDMLQDHLMRYGKAPGKTN